MPFGWRYLSEPTSDHFALWPRLLDHVVAATTTRAGGWPWPSAAAEARSAFAALPAALKWQRTGRRHWSASTVVAYASALCAFIKALLVLPLLVLVRYLRPDGAAPLRLP